MKFKYIEEVAIADIAFEGYGKDLNELFENCALAVFDSSADIKKIDKKVKKKIELKNSNVENLLYDFLSEILFLKDSESLIFKENKVKIIGKYKLTAVLYGENIDIDKHELKNDVKAITLHEFKIEKLQKGYKARIILDI